MSAGGKANLAPYSFFNAFSSRPPIVGFSSSSGLKDSVVFAAETREFVCNLATFEFRKQMNLTSVALPRGESEFVAAELEMEPSVLVKVPRVKGIAAALECRWLQTIEFMDLEGRQTDRWLVLGQVVGTYIDDRYVTDGRVDTARMRPIARCGYDEYAVVDRVFSMAPP